MNFFSYFCKFKFSVMKRFFFIILFSAMCGFATAQSVYDRFYEAVQGSDSAGMAEAINEIRASGDQSAERYIAEYNFYVNNALLFSGMTSSTIYPDENEHVVGDIMTLTDSTGEVAGYMYFIENWDEAIADSGIAIITKGISLYPDRLDMRYGKIHLLRQLHWWNAYADAIHATLDYAEKHRKTMIFADGDTPIDTILIEGILNYESSLFEAIQDSPDSLTFVTRLELLRGIAEHMLKIYPKDVYSMNIMAVTYQLVEDRENSLKWLLKAEKVDPKDVIVLSNIADTYHILGDYKNERKYLEKMIKYGDEETVEKAQRYLKELDNNKQ